MSNSVVRLPNVKLRCGLSRSSIYFQIKQGTFPKPISIGARAVGWLTSDIDDWLSIQIEKRRLCQDKEGIQHHSPLKPLSDRTNCGSASIERELTSEVLS
jgi:prophage regulatory protein